MTGRSLPPEQALGDLHAGRVQLLDLGAVLGGWAVFNLVEGR